MTFTVTEMTRCEGQGHWHFTVQVGNQTRKVVIKSDELSLDPDDIETIFLARIRSAAKEAGATSFATARNAILNKPFQI